MSSELPADLRAIIESGLLNRLRSKSDPLSVFDIQFYPSECIVESSPLADQMFPILPFGRNAAGDIWGYRCDRTPLDLVAIFYHDDELAEWVANSVVDLVFRQTLHFAGLTQVDETGDAWTTDLVRDYVASISTAFHGLLCDKMKCVLESVVNSHPVKSASGITLVSEDWVSEALSDFPIFASERTFQWRET